jgi:hypothetical protein
MDYVTAARTSDGATVMAYLPSSRRITVDMSKISGSQAKGWWFNPHTGNATASGEFTTRGLRDFTPPEEGDWVLVIDDASRKLPVPGAAVLPRSQGIATVPTENSPHRGEKAC